MKINCYSCLIITFLCINNLSSQSLTIEIDSSFKSLNFSRSLQFINTATRVSPSEAFELINSSNAAENNGRLGFSGALHWSSITFKNNSKKQQTLYWEIANSHIDQIILWKHHKNRFTHWWTTGDKYPFTQRPISHRHFIFPIKLAPNQEIQLLALFNKKKSAIHIPSTLWNDRSFIQKDSTQNLTLGLYFGWILICIIFSGLTFFFLKQPLYLWYLLYLCLFGLLIFIDRGFGHQFLFPSATRMNSYTRIIVGILCFISLMRFSTLLLNTKLYTPRLHQYISRLIFLTILLSSGGIIFQNTYYQLAAPLTKLFYVFCLAFFGLIITAAINILKHERILALYYLSAFGILISTVILYIMQEFGFSNALPSDFNPMIIGSAIEVFLLSLAITNKVKQIYEERNKLNLELSNQRKKSLKAYISGEEKERTRIAQELHDNIGSQLGHLQRLISKENRSASKQVSQLCEDVRTMSHELLPTFMKLTGFPKSIQELIKNSPIEIDLSFYDFPKNLPEEYCIHLYRIIQEALQNIDKHAEASHVDIQFFGHEKELVLTIEDNGKGFTQNITDGIGIQNMKNRTEHMNGTFDISSQVNLGTSILVQIPNNLN